MKATKIKAGKYQITPHGFVFTLTKEGRIDRWVLRNKSGIEVMWSVTKTSILNAISTYDGHRIESLNT